MEPTGSASATIILDDDIRTAMEICRNWTAEEPLDELMLLTRAEIQNGVPTRTNELSSLARDCVTHGGALVVERYGYKVHKTANAIRCIALEAELARKIKAARENIDAHRGTECLFLLRGLGRHEDGARDAFLAFLWSSALKLATGDQNARAYCVRAKALQEIAWPGWSNFASGVLRGLAGHSECCAWINEQFQRWTQTSFATIQAGHGDLRSALGNYLAGWSLIYHFYATSLLNDLEFAPEFLDQLSIKRNSFSVAAKRCITFNAWDWLQAHIFRRHVESAPKRSRTGASRLPQVPRSAKSVVAAKTLARSDSATSSRSDDSHGIRAPRIAPAPDRLSQHDRELVHRLDSESVTYLCARILSMPQAEAIEQTRTPLSTANRLERILIPEDLKAAAVRRARAAPDTSACKANQRMLLDSARTGDGLGRQIVDSLLRLSGPERLGLFRIVFRKTRRAPAPHALASMWVQLAAALPSTLRVLVHRSSVHVTEAEEDGLKDASTDTVAIKLDDDIGACPVLKVFSRKCGENRVVSSRLTSVFRAGLLAAVAIEFGKGAWDD